MTANRMKRIVTLPILLLVASVVPSATVQGQSDVFGEELPSRRTQNSQRSQDPFGQAAPRGFASPPATISSLTTTIRSSVDLESVREQNELSRQIREIVQQIRTADSQDEKEELKNEAQQLLEQQYDLYLAQHERPLKKLEERLETLRAEYEKRKTAKKDLVKLRLDTIWYDAIGMSWPTDNRTQSAFGLAYPGARSEFNRTLSLPASAVPAYQPVRPAPPARQPAELEPVRETKRPKQAR